MGNRNDKPKALLYAETAEDKMNLFCNGNQNDVLALAGHVLARIIVDIMVSGKARYPHDEFMDKTCDALRIIVQGMLDDVQEGDDNG